MQFAGTLLILIVMSMVCGCSSRQVSREDWLSMSTHIFPKTTVDAVLKAGDKVITLSDPSDVSVSHSQGRLYAYRRFMIYTVFSAAFGHYDFDLAAEQKGDNVVATLNMQNSMSMVFGGEIKQPCKWKEAYDLLYSRMDALLYGGTWQTCKDAEEKSEASWYLEPLCLLADDNIPESGVKFTDATQKSQTGTPASKTYVDKL